MRSFKTLWRAQKFNRAHGVLRARGTLERATSRARRLSGAPPLECTSSRARLYLERAHSRARRFSSALPLSPARRTPTLAALAGSSLPAWLVTAAVGFCRSISDLEERLDTAEKGRFEFALIINARARLSCDPRGHTLLCDRGAHP